MIKPKYKCNKKRKIENVTVENNEIEKHKNYSQQQWIGYCKIQHKHEILNKEKTVKPFFSKKCNSGDQNIILCEDNKIINDTCEVSEKFNTFFSTVADKIGEDTVYDPTTHHSILEIKNQVDVEKKFEFQHITSDKIEKIIDKINIKKSLWV